MLTSCSLPSLIWIKLGILPRKSSSVCIFTAALVVRNGAHGNSDSDKSIVVESRAYAVLARSTAKGFVDIQLASDADQALREVGVDAPVARGVRIGQRIARDLTADTHVVELLGLRAQTRFDVPQALAKRQLRKRHAQKLILTGEALDLVVAPIARYASRQGLLRKVFHELRKYQFPRMHQIPRSFGSGPPWHRMQLKSRTRSYACFF